MSVIVKDMNMPRHCGECACSNYYDQIDALLCDFTEKQLDEKTWKKERHPNCPLVELPPHGVLKDTTAFDERIREQYCKKCERRFGIKNGKRKEVYEIGGVPCRACDIGDMLDWLDDEPPIIEAEGSEI